jgi:hypothetical protein
MTEKKFKQVCKCENCGNEAEMTITCSWVPKKDETPQIKMKPDKDDPGQDIKGQAECSHCGNEADVWIDM